jgi:hypothetical protein
MLSQNPKWRIVTPILLAFSLASVVGCGGGKKKKPAVTEATATSNQVTPPESGGGDPTTINPKKDRNGDPTLENCRYFDKQQNLVEQIQGVPLPINISNYTAGKIPTGDTFAFEFELVRDYYDANKWSVEWDRARPSYVFAFHAIISDAQTAYCKITLDKMDEQPRTEYGCFAAGTLITLADGRQQPIEYLMRSQKILNPLTGAANDVIAVTKGPEAKPLFNVTVGASKVTVTENHPFLTEAGLKTAKELTTDDKIIDVDGSYDAVSALQTVAPAQDTVVYNLKLAVTSSDPKDHMILANGIVAGDLFIQEQLEKAAQK